DAKKSRLQGTPLRLWQTRQEIVCHRLEQICECGERELRLRLGRTALEHAQAGPLGADGRLPPERGLTDSGLTLDDERGRSLTHSVEEGIDHCDFRFPAEQRTRFHPAHFEPL